MDSEVIENIDLNQSVFKFGMLIGGDEASCPLGYENISQLCLYSDVTTGETILSFVYNDIGSSVLTKIEESSTSVIEFYFDSAETNKDESLQPIDAYFVVDKIMYKNGELSNSIYQVKATLAQSQLLRKNVEFSFSNLDPEDALLKLYKSADVEIKSQSTIGKPTEKISMIFDANDNLWEASSKLLEFLSSYNNGIYLIRYNIFDETYELIPFGKKQFGSKRSHVYVIPTQDGISDNKNTHVMKIKTPKTKMSASKSNEFIEENDFFTFDSKKRKWNKTTKKYDDAIKSMLLEDSINKMLYDVQNQQQDRNFSHTEVYCPNFDKLFGKKLLKMFYFGDTIEIEVLGDPRVLAGDVVGLKSKNESMEGKFGGVWCVSSVYHWIEKKSFTTRMILSRPFKIIPKESNN